jgi:hypothetical protein
MAATDPRPDAGRPATDPAINFMALVDSFVLKNPVKTKAVTYADIRWAAAKVLLYQTISPQSRDRHWPGTNSARLAGILFILFAEVGLSRKKRRNILGMTPEGVYELLEVVVSKSELTREELHAAVIASSTGKSKRALTLIQSYEIDVLFHHEVRPPLEVSIPSTSHRSPRKLRGPLSSPHSPDTPMSQLYEECLQTIEEEEPETPGPAPETPGPAGEPTARSYQFVVALACIAGFSLAELLIRRSNAKGGSNTRADAAHVLLALSMSALWMSAALICHQGQLSWKVLRVVLAADGLLVGITTMRARLCSLLCLVGTRSHDARRQRSGHCREASDDRIAHQAH